MLLCVGAGVQCYAISGVAIFSLYPPSNCALAQIFTMALSVPLRKKKPNPAHNFLSTDLINLFPGEYMARAGILPPFLY